MDDLMKILIVNDDGYDAIGIQEVFKAFEKYQPILVAPQFEQSAKGHSFTMDRPLRLQKQRERQYSVDGTPADCTYLALNHVCPETEVVVSGINMGANLGSDVFYSGTVAGAREGFLQGRNAFSFSMMENVDFDTVEERSLVYKKCAELALELVERLFDRNNVRHWNVNVPSSVFKDNESIEVVCKPMGQRHYIPTTEQRTDHRGRSYYWIGGPPLPLSQSDTDIYWCSEGKVVCTPLSIDTTCCDWKKLGEAIDGLRLHVNGV